MDALKTLVMEQSAQIVEITAEAAHYKARLEYLEEQIRLMRHKRFGASSEKSSADQLNLFDEAELSALDADNEVPDEADDSLNEADDTSTGKPKRRARRKPLPPELPRIREEHDLTDSEKVCSCGCLMDKIGEEISEQLEIIPAKVQVIQHVRFKYACRDCEEGIKTAPLPPQPIPKSNAAPGLLAYIIIAKFMDALPLYRQETIFKRLGVFLPRSTMARWMIQASILIQPLINLMRDEVNGYDIQHMDETRIQVLKEDGRAAASQSQIWVQKGGPPDKMVILYHYEISRGRSVIERLLVDFSGYLQTDGYSAYSRVRETIFQVGCWAHARRYFDEAVKAQGKKAAKGGKARAGLSKIQKLYAIEKRIADQSPEERKRVRQEQAKPILDEMEIWLNKSLLEVPPASLTGKALVYLRNQWVSLQRYLEDGRLSIDNNSAERAIKPFVIGRKNWLFADTPKGAHASAALYSLIETAKANGLEPYAYLRHVFKELPKAKSLEDVERLLPYNVDVKQFT